MKIPVLIALATERRVGRSSFLFTTYKPIVRLAYPHFQILIRAFCPCQSFQAPSLRLCLLSYCPPNTQMFQTFSRTLTPLTDCLPCLALQKWLPAIIAPGHQDMLDQICFYFQQNLLIWNQLKAKMQTSSGTDSFFSDERSSSTVVLKL